MWDSLEGQDLALFDHPADTRLVACLNVWNDAEELAANIGTWAPHVDHIIALDGPYRGIPYDGPPTSSDGTLELLQEYDAQIFSGVEWPDQCVKKSAFFAHTGPGDVLLFVDADEEYRNVESIRDMPYFDVGWLRYSAPIYARAQHIPRLVRWREGLEFRDRHHHIYCGPDLVCTNQRGGSGLIHRLTDATFHNSRGLRRKPTRQRAAEIHRHEQTLQEAKNDPTVTAVGHEPLHVLQLGPFDPGAVIFRLHTAINTTTPSTSAMATGLVEYIQEPRQFDAVEDAETLHQLAEDADVVHYHVTRYGHYLVNTRTPRVTHHHGTVYRTEPDVWNQRDKDAALRLVSNLELLQYGDDLHYLPNPVPVAEYRKLGRREWDGGVLHVGHSPTKRGNKGTEVFFDAVDRCRRMGVKICLHLVERASLEASIRMKSDIHVFFDSFWLGMQCSGLEAAAIGVPVIAGDEYVHAKYQELYGYCPYTYANDGSDLVNTLCAMAEDEEFYRMAAERVHTHVATYHDPAYVANRYLELLDQKLNWRANLQLGRPGTLWRR